MGEREDRKSEMNRIQAEIDRYEDLINAADPDKDDYDDKVDEWETRISNLKSRLTFFR